MKVTTTPAWDLAHEKKVNSLFHELLELSKTKGKECAAPAVAEPVEVTANRATRYHYTTDELRTFGRLFYRNLTTANQRKYDALFPTTPNRRN